MNFPPQTPGSVKIKTLAWLKLGGKWGFGKKSLMYCSAQNVSPEYIHSCLINHFQTNQKVYQKPKDDGTGMLPNSVMELNLELPGARTESVYVWMVLERFKVTICNLHTHYTTPLPR